SRFGSLGDVERVDWVPVRGQHVRVDGADRELLFQTLFPDPCKLLPLIGRSTAGFPIVLVVDVDADEAAVEQIDDTAVGERTRPHTKRTPSTAAGIDLAVSCVEKNRPVVLRAELDRAANTGNPRDLVEAL